MLNPLFVVSLVSTTSTRRVRHQIMTGQINKMGTVSSSFFHEGNPSKYVKVSWLEVPEFSIGLSKKRGTWLTRQSKHELSTKSEDPTASCSTGKAGPDSEGQQMAVMELAETWRPCDAFLSWLFRLHHIYIRLISFDIIWFHWQIHSWVSRICWHTWGRSYPQHVGYRIKLMKHLELLSFGFQGGRGL